MINLYFLCSQLNVLLIPISQTTHELNESPQFDKNKDLLLNYVQFVKFLTESYSSLSSIAILEAIMNLWATHQTRDSYLIYFWICSWHDFTISKWSVKVTVTLKQYATLCNLYALTKFGIPMSNNIEIYSGYVCSKIVVRGLRLSNLKWYLALSDPNMDPYTKYRHFDFQWGKSQDHSYSKMSCWAQPP